MHTTVIRHLPDLDESMASGCPRSDGSYVSYARCAGCGREIHAAVLFDSRTTAWALTDEPLPDPEPGVTTRQTESLGYYLGWQIRGPRVTGGEWFTIATATYSRDGFKVTVTTPDGKSGHLPAGMTVQLREHPAEPAPAAPFEPAPCPGHAPAPVTLRVGDVVTYPATGQTGTITHVDARRREVHAQVHGVPSTPSPGATEHDPLTPHVEFWPADDLATLPVDVTFGVAVHTPTGLRAVHQPDGTVRVTLHPGVVRTWTRTDPGYELRITDGYQGPASDSERATVGLLFHLAQMAAWHRSIVERAQARRNVGRAEAAARRRAAATRTTLHTV